MHFVPFRINVQNQFYFDQISPLFINVPTPVSFLYNYFDKTNSLFEIHKYRQTLTMKIAKLQYFSAITDSVIRELFNNLDH